MTAATVSRAVISTWEFSKIRGTLFWGPYNKDPTNQGTTILGTPIFGNSHLARADGQCEGLLETLRCLRDLGGLGCRGLGVRV